MLGGHLSSRPGCWLAGGWGRWLNGDNVPSSNSRLMLLVCVWNRSGDGSGVLASGLDTRRRCLGWRSCRMVRGVGAQGVKRKPGRRMAWTAGPSFLVSIQEESPPEIRCPAVPGMAQTGLLWECASNICKLRPHNCYAANYGGSQRWPRRYPCSSPVHPPPPFAPAVVIMAMVGILRPYPTALLP
jgi:hypothetical protein